MSSLISNLPALLNQLKDGSLAHELASKFDKASDVEAARSRVLSTLEAMVEAEKGETDED